MLTTTDLLTLSQWLSPAYPVGAFAYSHGVETAITEGQLTDAATLTAWTEDLLRFGSGHNDALLLAAAYHADNPAGTDATARALCASTERLLETTALGTAFANVTREVWQLDLPDLTYPVAVGRAAQLRGLPLEPASALYLQSLTSSLISVGQRLIPIGQTEGQRAIAALTPVCEEIALSADHGDLDQLSSTAFASDIAAMRHETLGTRIFRT